MGGWRREEAGQSASGESERDGGMMARRGQGLNEVGGRDPTEQASEEDRLGGQALCVQLGGVSGGTGWRRGTYSEGGWG